VEGITLFGRTFTTEQLRLGAIALSILIGLMLFLQNDLPKMLSEISSSFSISAPVPVPSSSRSYICASQ